ncbi:regulatory protein RecX [Sediminibacterium ginsengisoli]|uniref:Regulatory protein RecX n=1 Tax=Sediminibacterium ginsengisoli TaxID=413434 RepID=A0A1T4MBV8_9BACT|nr:regulatory protein RecX [Sediminibacterium ginsengisoli]SJZ64258.1 regulatory protein [Sediminibacterium ginsengisoli]
MFPRKQQTRLTPEQALQKIRHYCAYQERAHQETKEKLYGMGLSKKDVETLLAQLIEEDYLNESRFATQFAGGHFRLKKWGRQKIVYELKQKRVSDYNIKAALKEIPEEDYRQTLRKLAETRWKALRGEQYLVRQSKTTTYLLAKGYESALVQKAVAACRAAGKE